jgi:hemerythrin
MAARFAEALMEWFEQHAASMDAVLAQWMQSRGYVPALDADLLLVQPQ